MKVFAKGWAAFSSADSASRVSAFTRSILLMTRATGVLPSRALSESMIAAEITREKLTLRLHEEIPYQLTVETEAWEERKDASARVDQIVYVARPGHKGIVLGKGGETIKAVGQAARAELEEFMGRRVHLFLQVKVRENWLDEAERYNEMGLDFRDGDA